MQVIRLVSTFACLCFLTVSAYAQAQVSGQVYALLYAWENADANQQWDYYQGLQLRVRPSPQANLSFKTNLRIARRGDPADWDERIYNAYAEWQSPRHRIHVRLGRQFVHYGVVNGSFDAVMIRVKPTPKWDLRLVGGTVVPFDRGFAVRKWDDGNVLGGYASYQFVSQARFDLSYVQRSREDKIIWQQVGAALTGAWKKKLYYQAQFDYNLQDSEYQGMRYRLTYQSTSWSVSGEYNSQKPRIYEDSFFNIFKLVAFDQLRGGVTYQAGKYQIGAQFLHTIYKRDETNDEFMLTIGRAWGTIGVVYQTGFGGDNVGIYGEVRREILPNLTVKLHSSHYTYERRSLTFNEDATAFSGGLHYRPVRALLIQAEVQESMNSFYENDLRALLRINYAFSLK